MFRRFWSHGKISPDVVSPTPPPSYENFTTYTLVDPQGVYTVTAGKSIVTGLEAKNHESYLYKDFGAGYFTSGTVINFEVFMTTPPASSANCWSIALSNVLMGYRNSGQAVGSVVDYSWTDHPTKFEIWTNARNYAGLYLAIPVATLYYGTLTYVYGSPSQVKVDVYSDAARTVLVVSLDRNDIPQAKVDSNYRYLIVTSSYGDMSVALPVVTFYVQNVEIISH